MSNFFYGSGAEFDEDSEFGLGLMIGPHKLELNDFNDDEVVGFSCVVRILQKLRFCSVMLRLRIL